MFTEYTYQDWENTPDKSAILAPIIKAYKASDDFRVGLLANQYFASENPETSKKMLLRPTVVESKDANGKVTKKNRTTKIPGNRVYSNFFFRFVTQQNQYLLGNGVTLDDDTAKEQLGLAFDKTVEQIGEKALKHGVCWGYWNLDHLECIEAVADGMSGAVALVDERTSEPMVLVQFWQINTRRPLYIRVYEVQGISEYVADKGGIRMVQDVTPYKLKVEKDALGVINATGEGYGVLPVVPFWASEEKRSELTYAIKSKIDMYDRILSDFGDNLDRACDIYWVLNNFGGTMSEIAETIAAIEQLKAVANISDGTGSSSTVEPHTIDVPYAARKEALELLEKQLYQDYMALSMSELTGGSLTNVAIETAMTNLNLKADRYEWQAHSFVQKVLGLVGVETEKIRFKRQSIANRSEIVQDIAVMRQDIDQRTALMLNPYIEDQGEIDRIMNDTDAEKLTDMPMDKLDAAIRGDGQ